MQDWRRMRKSRYSRYEKIADMLGIERVLPAVQRFNLITVWNLMKRIGTMVDEPVR